MKITWKVDDGYVNNGPHTTEIDDEELEDFETEEEKEEFIEQCITGDFERKVSWYEISRE